VYRLILASASPARLNLLRHAGMDPEVVVSGVDESTVEATDPTTVAGTLARMKAEAVAAAVAPDATTTLVIGCDSVLEFDGQVLGKPVDATDAARRWRAMRGRTGVLHTGHCLVVLPPAAPADPPEERATIEGVIQAVAETTVHFAEVTDAEIDAYVGSGEPLQVAGAFTIDGLGGPFVERLEGDHGTVVGLSLPLLRRLLAEFGISVADLWHHPTNGNGNGNLS
jgi:septum formation protein